MKPMVNTLGCGNKGVVVVYQREVLEVLKKTRKPKRKAWMITSVLIGFVLMAAATIIILRALSNTHYRSYWASYHLDNGITISEQITLSESEEDVTVPGKVRVIFDFEHALFVMRLADKEVCFVSEFNTTGLATPGQVNEHLKALEQQHHSKLNSSNGLEIKTDHPMFPQLRFDILVKGQADYYI